jgi:hypothetical protein
MASQKTNILFPEALSIRKKWKTAKFEARLDRPAGRSDHDQQHCYHHAPKVKPEAATAVVKLLMMGVRRPETC